MGLTVSGKTAKTLAVKSKNEKSVTIKKNLTIK